MVVSIMNFMPTNLKLYMKWTRKIPRKIEFTLSKVLRRSSSLSLSQTNLILDSFFGSVPWKPHMLTCAYQTSNSSPTP